MDRLYTIISEAIDGVRIWLGEHKDLGGRVIARICIFVFMGIGFLFLFKSLGMP